MGNNHDSGCLKLVSIGAGLATIVGVGIALCAWLFPFQAASSGQVSNHDSLPTLQPSAPTQPLPTACFWSFTNVRPASVKFFESGSDIPAVADRLYASEFSVRTTRYVNWEITLDFGCPAPQREDFVIEVIYYNPDNTLRGQYSSNRHVEQGWQESIHADGWGWDDPGNWDEGRYRVTIKIPGLVDVTHYFDIGP